jgi:hypothetical protein
VQRGAPVVVPFLHQHVASGIEKEAEARRMAAHGGAVEAGATSCVDEVHIGAVSYQRSEDD